MNHFHAQAVFENGAWRGKVRYCHRSTYAYVMDGDRPASFETADAAEIAALRAQEKHINGTIVGFGERVEAARAAAERLFTDRGTTSVSPRNQNGSTVIVEVKRRRMVG